MKDLASRLREIVRRERPAAADDGLSLRAPVRELTYVPDVDGGPPVADAATRLGGIALDANPNCIVVDRLYEGDRTHGRRRIDDCRPDATLPIHLFDERVTRVPAWARRVVFFDIETTGLSGGAGTVAFLAGCGWFEADGFRVRQFFLAGASGEKALLDALADVFDDASLLVTFNGRTFDVPFMEMRWAFHRREPPTEGIPHFDMLPPARRLWSQREMAVPETDGCSLSALERRVLGFHRVNDVPGFEIPARYFQFLRTGEPDLVSGVLEHNRHDIVSTAVVMSHALWLAREGPDACREPAEQVALGRLYERADDGSSAQHAYERALACGDREVQRHASSRLAELHRRAGRHVDAARAWQQILDLVPRGRRTLTALERRAVEGLAIHHEHRAKDLPAARRYAEALGATVSGRYKHDADRRLRRLARKLDAIEPDRNGRLGYDPADIDESSDRLLDD